jgi:hypothetical protein
MVALLLALAAVREPGRWPAPEPTPYQGEAAAKTGPGHSAVALARLIREPQNTWSNLAFIVGGACLLVTSRTRPAQTLGVPVVAVGIGSFLYHASAATRLRQLDVAAMYWLCVLATVYCASLAWPKRTGWIRRHHVATALSALVLALALTLARNVTLMGFKPLSLTVVTVLASAGLLLTLAAVAHRRESVSAALQLLGIVTVFGAAVFLQVGDRPGGRLYRPDAILQAHAVWHMLAALAFTWAIAVLDRYSLHEPDTAPR